MKQRLLPSLAIGALLVSSYCVAQKNTAFAVTAPTKGSFNWNVIREIDLSTGAVIRTVYDPSVKKSINYKLTSGQEKGNSFLTSATGSGVAAAAYDVLHNRLYFTGMHTSTLMYFDFSSNNLDVVVNDNPAFNTGEKNDEANVVTRMAISSDGIGYAITNDGKSLIRFTTDEKPSVTNLGQLIDGKKNGSMSIHSQCSSWGGDMVGDAYGNMYIVTYRNHLFRLNPKTKITDYVGSIKGLPAEFTTNGLVVNDEGEMVVTSATQSDDYFKVNISTLQATAINKKEDKVFNSSDLANSNLLYQTKGNENSVWPEVRGNDALSVFPNPVPGKAFTIQFDKIPTGRYNLALTDAQGRSVINKLVNVGVRGQTEKVSLPRASAGGMYLMKLTGSNRNVFYSNKVAIK